MAFTHLFFQGTVKTNSRAATNWPMHWPLAEPSKQPANQLIPLAFSLAGLPIEPYRASAYQRRLQACLRYLRLSTEAEACQKLQQQPTLASELVDVVVLGVSAFFRDSPVFESIDQKVLPMLLERHPSIRIWSAACSSGQELYSVAMLLKRRGVLERAELVGTDCRVTAIAQARAGVYSPREGESLGERNRDFAATSPWGVVIDPELRAAASWRVADLFAGPEAGPWHLILWRNMAIYLDHGAVPAVWSSLAQQLVPGGIIVAGKADFPPASLGLRRLAPCVFQRNSV